MMRGVGRSLVGVICASMFLAPAFATDAGEKQLIVNVAGKVMSESKLALSFWFGAPVSNAVRVYSEPSHTLLVAILDREFAQSAQGASWRQAQAPDSNAPNVVVTTLPEGQPNLVIPAPPQGDTRVAIWVAGAWPNGASDERLVSDAALEGQDFEFSTFLSESGGFEHCCSGGDCGTICTTCSGPAHTCCLIAPDCCRIACGFDPGLCVGPGCP